MLVSTRVLNRTLWVRQQLVPGLRSVGSDPLAVVEHLIGLQAQETAPPYLSLAARIADFDPTTLSDAIEQRDAVRLLTMRGTVHVLTPSDALALRPWMQSFLERSSNVGSAPARRIPSTDLYSAAADALADGPLPVADLEARLSTAFPDVPPPALRAAARERLPLVQVPPRGLWQRSGGVVYQLLETWLDAPHTVLDLPELVRRYLRAFGPASAADMTKWSSVTGLAPVFASMRDELVTHTTEAGKTLFDVPDGVIADADLELPPVLLGNYDNLWLSHADRTRITTDENRRHWSGPNGGVGAAVFVDGMFEGVWNRSGGELTVTPFRRFTKNEQRGVDAEIARIRAMLAGDGQPLGSVARAVRKPSPGAARTAR